MATELEEERALIAVYLEATSPGAEDPDAAPKFSECMHPDLRAVSLRARSALDREAASGAVLPVRTSEARE